MKTETFDYEIKIADESDIDALVKTALEFWNESGHSVVKSENPDKYAAFLKEECGKPGRRIIIAKVGERVVGYHIIYCLGDYKDELDGEMYQFFVHPEYRGSGVARDLVHMAVQTWDDWGCDVNYAIASPELGNIELSQFRNLFAKFGFVETGIVMTRRPKDGRR